MAEIENQFTFIANPWVDVVHRCDLCDEALPPRLKKICKTIEDMEAAFQHSGLLE